MSVTSVGLDQSIASSGGRSAIRQAHQDFDQIYQSLQNGNLSAAQQAYSDFQQTQAGLTSTSATPANAVGATTAASPVVSDWSALGQALQSGSLSSAQDALSKLQTDAQAIWQAHLQQETQNAQSVYALMQSVQPAAATPGTTSASTQPAGGSVQSDLTALSQALQAGDASAAQKLLAQLEQDLQASGQIIGRHHHHHHHSGAADVTTPANTATAVPTTSATLASTGSAVSAINSGNSVTA